MSSVTHLQIQLFCAAPVSLRIGIEIFNFIHLHSINWTWGQCFLFFAFPLQIMLVFSPLEVLIGRIKHVMNTFILWLATFDWFGMGKKPIKLLLCCSNLAFPVRFPSMWLRVSRSTAWTETCEFTFVHQVCTKLKY